MRLQSPEPKLAAAMNSTARALYRAQLAAMLDKELNNLASVPADADFRACQGRAQVLKALINQLDNWTH